ncbi:F-box only protein 15 [Diplogelasinospora grovesii]|uniref:F-box only protein 15 n=1 Tax=Diplogelasinospora grovesii TaxID=303347 RepID=A0AAN6N4E2_9PEZI|nr:F-box only protein 15 [Diplogelasinospora grovesii]
MAHAGSSMPPTAKRTRSDAFLADDTSSEDGPPTPPPKPRIKRRRVVPADAAALTGSDLLSPLSDELLIRILSFLSLPHLLAVAPVSRRFYHLSGDSQLWKALYYARFVLPRALRIPGFRDGTSAAAVSGGGHKLHYSGRRALWADGRRGGLVMPTRRVEEARAETPEHTRQRDADDEQRHGVNWKRQYKIRYNWSRGKCAVEELRIGEDENSTDGRQQGRKQMLVKVIEGIAITADRASGLRAWHLKSRQLLAQISLQTEDDAEDGSDAAAPSCIAVEDREMDSDTVDVAVGFMDGSFGLWRLEVAEKRLVRRYRHGKSSNGELMAMALSHPYLLTATQSVLISLYTFDISSQPDTGRHTRSQDKETAALEAPESACDYDAQRLRAPYLLTSLNSHTSRPPLALSIRRTATTAIASIAYTFSTRRGWSIGIQDLHIGPSADGGSSSSKSAPEISTTRIAHASPVDTSNANNSSRYAPRSTPLARRQAAPSLMFDSLPANPGFAPTTNTGPGPTRLPYTLEPGPTALCYTHPYLLATLPDNTLLLYLCTSNAASLSISPGIRLWGHTSAISDAEITARGKAVSVSSRGDEMRVWELEGRPTSMGRSVEIRPGQSPAQGSASNTPAAHYDWDERRNWVGFDDEMVIVLKERKGGRESLMVYDFT